MDFINPLSATSDDNIYILNLIYYFSRFNIPYIIKAANIEDIVSCLKIIFTIY